MSARWSPRNWLPCLVAISIPISRSSPSPAPPPWPGSASISPEGDPPMPHLSHSIDGVLATITLHNPPQNRLSPEMLDNLDAALGAIGRSEARALLLVADGPDFSFGGDIVPWPEMTQRERRTLFEHYMSSFNQFERLAIPTVAAVQGLFFGGGLELAVRADIVFAGETARF